MASIGQVLAWRPNAIRICQWRSIMYPDSAVDLTDTKKNKLGLIYSDKSETTAAETRMFLLSSHIETKGNRKTANIFYRNIIDEFPLAKPSS